jgi:DNA-binding CsgD family transcriptional regulator
MMKPLNRKYCNIVFTLMGMLWAYPLQAFPPELPTIHSYLKNDFDITSQNWGISQHPDSKYIYFANSDGLIVFNGVGIEKHVLKENRPVRSVMVHNDGRIFTGSFEEFGYWQYNDKGQLNYTSLALLTEPEKNDEIWKIYEKDNTVYFQSFTSIYKYEANKIEKFMAPYAMLFLHLIDDRFIVQIIDNGLYWFDDGRFLIVENSEIFKSQKVHAIIPYDEETWLICTEKGGLYLFDGKEFAYLRSEASDFLKEFTCNAAKQLSDSAFAFGSILNGLIITDRYGNIQESYNTNNGLNNNTVLSLFIDADRGLWVGLDEGVNHLDILSPFTFYATRNGTMGTIYALLRKDEFLYIGTNHGLFMATIVQKGHIFSFENLQFIKGSQGQVWNLSEIEGEIFCGHNDGTFLVKGTHMENISSVTGGWSFTPYNGYVLVGTYTGIIVIERSRAGQWMFRNKIEGFLEPTRYIETDYLGYIWASHHQKGIYKIELTDDLKGIARKQLITDIGGRTYNINVFKINNRVVFNTGEKIYTWDFVRDEIVEFEILNENLGEYESVNQIIHFQKNKYWFIGDDKMALFDVGLDFDATQLLEIPQIMVILPQRSIQLVSLNENTLLKPNHQNFDAINLDLAARSKTLSRLSVEKMLFFGKNDTLIWFDHLPDKKLPSKINNLTVFFSNPADFSNYPKTYYFRITQLDQAWQSTDRNFFTYLDLKHGEYTLEITTEISEKPLHINFSVAKPWRFSNTAYILYFILFGLLTWSLVVFFRFEISRQKELVSLEIQQNRLEKELDYKSYELLLIMRHLMLKDDILNELHKQIKVIKTKSSKYPVKYLSQMEKIIAQGLGTQNVEWENAMKNLKLTQQGFFKVLKEKYPELTSNDLRLCSYLKLNFNSKEIARLLNISPRSVEISRHRLRKKLKLRSEQNLFDFLIDLDNSMTSNE